MKKKIIALIVLAAMLLGLLSACAQPPAGDPAPVDEPTIDDAQPEPPRPPEERPALQPREGYLCAETEAAIFHFSQTLFREVLAMGEENPVISPLSAYYALAMVALGAGGETRAEFEAVLGRDPEKLAAELYALARSLTYTRGSTALTIAGSVWTAEDFTIAPDFAAAMMDYFAAPAESRDFSAQTTVDEINAWVSEQTEGLIEELIQEIGRDEVMLLINTLYFSAKWAEAFNPMTEGPGEFRPAAGPAIEVPFLTAGRGSKAVSVTNTYEAAMLPYDDGRLGFLLVRPTDGTPVRDFVVAHDLGAIMAGLAMEYDVQVRMPKLDLEFEIGLIGLLEAMGLREVFGDFADLSGLLEEDMPLRISRVLQKVRLIVDE